MAYQSGLEQSAESFSVDGGVCLGEVDEGHAQGSAFPPRQLLQESHYECRVDRRSPWFIKPHTLRSVGWLFGATYCTGSLRAGP